MSHKKERLPAGSCRRNVLQAGRRVSSFLLAVALLVSMSLPAFAALQGNVNDIPRDVWDDYIARGMALQPAGYNYVIVFVKPSGSGSSSSSPRMQILFSQTQELRVGQSFYHVLIGRDYAMPCVLTREMHKDPDFDTPRLDFEQYEGSQLIGFAFIPDHYYVPNYSTGYVRGTNSLSFDYEWRVDYIVPTDPSPSGGHRRILDGFLPEDLMIMGSALLENIGFAREVGLSLLVVLLFVFLFPRILRRFMPGGDDGFVRRNDPFGGGKK